MRNLAILMSATALAACGGEGATSVSSASSSTPVSTTTSATSSAAAYGQFANPTVTKTYAGVGGSQVFEYVTDERTPTNGSTGLIGFKGQQASTYASNGSTVRDSKISVTYDPSGATFTLQVVDPLTGASASTRFQDPANRTNFGGTVEPQWGTDDFSTYPGVGKNSNIRFLQAGDGSPLSPYGHSGSGFVNPGTNKIAPTGQSGSSYQATNLFYDPPGATNQYVTLAGYVRNAISWQDVTAGTTTFQQTKYHLERGAFVYGVATDQAAVPKTGTGTYTGSMLATMVFNPTIDGSTAAVPLTGGDLATYFQWISGTSTTTVNFASNTVGLALSGIVGAGQFDAFTTPQRTSIAAGTTFTASGAATIDLVNTGGFTGAISSASFGSTTNGSSPVVNVIGSSINGTFYGPNGEEIGGGFRVVGGTPDQRVDILGAFKGRKP